MKKYFCKGHGLKDETVFQIRRILFFSGLLVFTVMFMWLLSEPFELYKEDGSVEPKIELSSYESNWIPVEIIEE